MHFPAEESCEDENEEEEDAAHPINLQIKLFYKTMRSSLINTASFLIHLKRARKTL